MRLKLDQLLSAGTRAAKDMIKIEEHPNLI